MASNNVGNLNVKLTLTAEQFAAALASAGGDVNAFAMKVEASKQALVETSTVAAATTTNIKSLSTSTKTLTANSTAAAGAVTRVGAASRGIGNAFTAGAYAAQDFASQVGTRGIGAGLQAMANNISQMTILIPGWGRVIGQAAALGVQGVGMYVESLERAAKASKDLAAASTIRLDSLVSSSLAPIHLSREIRNATSVSQISAMRESRTNQLDEFRRLDAVLRNELTNPQQRMDAAMEKQDRINRGQRFAGVAETKSAELQAVITQARNEIDDINLRRKAIAEQSDKVQRQVDQIDRSGAFKAAILKERAEETAKRNEERDAARKAIFQQYETPEERMAKELKALDAAVAAKEISAEERDLFASRLVAGRGSRPGSGAGGGGNTLALQDSSEAFQSIYANMRRVQQSGSQKDIATNTKAQVDEQKKTNKKLDTLLKESTVAYGMPL